MRILKKIGFKSSLYNEIEKSAKLHNLDLTKEVNRLCVKGLSSDDILLDINNLKNEIKEIEKLNKSILSFIKQIYANMELDPEDISKSECIKKYYEKHRKDKFID